MGAKHVPCTHQQARGHCFGKKLGLFLTRKNEDTGIPTSCLRTEAWIGRLLVSLRCLATG